jgi:hypothetical protein
MAADRNRELGAILALGAATFALDCYSTFCSSPQTTELNAAARADTLMKWVGIGGGVAVAGGAVASFYAGSWAPLFGAVSVALVLWYCYVHAKNVGLANGGQTTESY